MGKFVNVVFYLFTFLALASTLVVLLSKETKHYIYGAIGAFVSIGGLYLLLKSPAMFVFQILFFILGLGSLLIYLSKNTKTQDSMLNLNGKSIITPFALAAFALLISPFLIHQVNAQKITSFSMAGLSNKFINILDLNMLLIGVIAVTALGGFYTIAFWRRK